MPIFSNRPLCENDNFFNEFSVYVCVLSLFLFYSVSILYNTRTRLDYFVAGLHKITKFGGKTINNTLFACRSMKFGVFSIRPIYFLWVPPYQFDLNVCMRLFVCACVRFPTKLYILLSFQLVGCDDP